MVTVTDDKTISWYDTKHVLVDGYKKHGNVEDALPCISQFLDTQ